MQPINYINTQNRTVLTSKENTKKILTQSPLNCHLGICPDLFSHISEPGYFCFIISSLINHTCNAYFSKVLLQ